MSNWVNIATPSTFMSISFFKTWNLYHWSQKVSSVPCNTPLHHPFWPHTLGGRPGTSPAPWRWSLLPGLPSLPCDVPSWTAKTHLTVNFKKCVLVLNSGNLHTKSEVCSAVFFRYWYGNTRSTNQQTEWPTETIQYFFQKVA